MDIPNSVTRLSLPTTNLDSLSGLSKVWIYQANEALSESKSAYAQRELESFCKNWQSHGTPLRAASAIYFNQFIVIAVDELASGASGCSIDKSVAMLKNIEEVIDISLLGREKVAALKNGKIELYALPKLKSAVADGLLKPETLVFNNMAHNLETFRSNWLVPAENTWIAKYFRQPILR